MKCEKCNINYKSLEAHLSKSEICKDENLLFSCKKCEKTFININDYHSHECIKITKDQSLLKSCQIYLYLNDFLKGMVEKNLNIKLPDMVLETDKEIKIYKDLPIHHVSKKDGKRSRYTAVSSKKLSEISESPKEIPVLDTGDIDLSKILERSLEIVGTLSKTSKGFENPLGELRDNRKILMKCFEMDEYSSFVEKDLKAVGDILIEKGLGKKIPNLLKNHLLSSIETRLSFISGYNEVEISSDEIDDYLKILKLKRMVKDRDIFDKSLWCNRMLNYSLALFDIKEFLKIEITGRNLIYLPLTKSTPEDPFSFYILEKIDIDLTKRWRMELRLEDLTLFIIDNISGYCIHLFKKLYYDIYRDNKFRINFGEEKILDRDGKQLILNLFVVSDFYSFNKFLQNMVISNNTYSPTEKDKFNLRTDDTYQRKQFYQNYIKEDRRTVFGRYLTQIFDEITQKEISDYYQLKMLKSHV